MKVLFLGEPLIIDFIPRIYPETADVLTLSMRNESSNVELTPTITHTTTTRTEITLTSQPTDFKTRSKYEIEVKNGSKTIYRGKVLILESGTDIQNYEYQSQSDAKFGYKE